MTEQDIRAQVMAAINADADEPLAKKAVANLIAHALHQLQRIADALEGKRSDQAKG